jgi:hypothetical protein
MLRILKFHEAESLTMNFIYVLMAFFAMLIAVPPANADSLEETGTVVKKSAEPGVRVSGGVRQTITAVYPGPSPKQEKTSEAWLMTFLGLLCLLMTVWAFFSPKAFMFGRRSWFWRELIGEKATAILIRIISFCVGVTGLFLMLAGIITLMKV